MKSYLILLFTSILFLPCIAQVPGNVPTQNLIAWYGFSGNSLDSSGNGNHLINNGATLTTDRNGALNSAYSFNGTSNNMTNLVPAFTFGETSSFTISFWMNKNTSSGGAMPYWHGLTQGNGGANKFCYFFHTNPTGVVRWRVNKQGSPWLNCESTYTSATWEHYVVVYHNQAMTLYKNGVSVATNTYTYTNTLTATMPFFVGSSSVNSAYFPGKLDDFGIWGRALTLAEINGLYSSCTAPIIGGTSTITSCGNYTSTSGINYPTTGIYQDTILTTGGCDSIITLDLTVNYSSNDTITSVNCNSYTSSGGIVYTTTGTYVETYTNALNCDSLITIELTIFNGYPVVLNETDCDSYISPSGKTWTTSGTYFDTIANGTGCDSLYTIHLTINQSTSTTISGSGCDAFISGNGFTYTTSGTYTEVVSSSTGCDSIITLNITLSSIDTNVTVNGGTITAVVSGLDYRWLDCADNYAPISTGNQQSYTPINSGDYAVKITDGTCIDTSSCHNVLVSGIGTISTMNNLSIYPNPAKQMVSFENFGEPITVNVLSITGEDIFSIEIPKGNIQVDISHLSSGIYLVSYILEKQTIIQKLIIE